MTTSGYTLLSVPQPEAALIHRAPGVEELGRVYQAQMMIARACAIRRRGWPP